VFLRDMAETPEGPMPKKREKSEDAPVKLTATRYFYMDYEAATELVRMLRGLGVMMHVSKCPRCGAEGSISVVTTKSGYKYLIIRHPDGSTHTVPKTHMSEVLRELCEVKKDLEYILKWYREFERGGVKFCEDKGQ